MTSPTPAELYHRWLDELWNGSPASAHELVTPDFVGHWPDRDVSGPEELAAVIGQTHEMFTAITFTLEVGPLVDGNLVAGRWIGHGHAANGATTFVGNDILRVHDGRLTEYWNATSVRS